MTDKEAIDKLFQEFGIVQVWSAIALYQIYRGRGMDPRSAYDKTIHDIQQAKEK